MNRIAPWLVLLVAGIGTLVWVRLERRPRPREGARAVAEAPADARAASATELVPPAPLEPEPVSVQRAAPAPARTALEPTAPARMLPVRVQTRASFARDAAAVPGLAFEVFALRPAVGGPAHVPTDRPLYAGRTDESGTASFEVDAEFALALGGLSLLCGRVVEPGYQQFTSKGKDSKGGVELVLLAQRGATARGHVVDEQGAGVEATVRLRRVRTQFGEPFAYGPTAKTFGDGWFELHYDEPIRDGWLLAEAGLRGTGTLADLELSLADPPTDLRIVVSGPGVLSGCVRDGDGEPAPRLDLLIELAELDRRDGTDPPASLALARESEGGGHLSWRQETDPSGEFEVRGLRRAYYVARARVGQGAQEYSVLLTSQPVLADGVPLELTLHRPQVLVRLVQEEEHSPWAVPELTSRAVRRERLATWPAMPHVMLYPCTPAGGKPLATGDVLTGKRLGQDGVLFDVSDGARYLAGARGPGFDGTLQVVQVPAGANRVMVELRARELGPLGSVAVRVFHAGEELRSGENLALALETPAEGVRLVERSEKLPAPPWVLGAPAGHYRLVVEGKPCVTFQHGTLVTPRAFGRVECEVVLRAGLTQELTLELDAGARLEVTLAGAPDEADRAAMRRGDAWNPPQDPGDESLRSVLATLTLEQPGRRPETLSFARSAGPTAVSGTDLLTRWPLGATQRSEVVPTGRFTLVARLPGGRERRQEVELVAGTVTAVRLEF